MDLLFHQLETNSKNIEFKIIDLSGKVIKKGISDNNQIFVGDLKNGYYFIQLSDDNRNYVGKIIKQ